MCGLVFSDSVYDLGFDASVGDFAGVSRVELFWVLGVM